MGEYLSATTATTVTVTTTYLELAAYDAFKPALSADPSLTVIQARYPLPAFYRFLYSAVGSDYQWLDRSNWSDQQLLDYLSQPEIVLLVLYVSGTPAGYIELNVREKDSDGIEVVYFGLIPAFHGKGYGKYLLSYGVQLAFDQGAQRVWLHTCTLDGPYALKNYQARGFRPFKTTTHEQTLEQG